MIVSSGSNFRTCLVNLFSSWLTNRQWLSTKNLVFFLLKKPSKPDCTDPSVLRPLCMSSHIGKVFERILNNRIKTFLMNNNLIDHEQEGFLPAILSRPKQGVPQGSVLSPLLFIFYIADMLIDTAGIKFKVADLSQIFVITDNQSTTCLTVEQILNAVEKWCRTWRIQLNGTKTEIVPTNLDVNLLVFKLSGEKRKRNYETKILGLTADDSFSFKRNAEKITARCKGRWKEMGIHSNKKKGLSRNTLVLLYISFVLPTLKLKLKL